MEEKIRKLLMEVDKPFRYSGGEFNTPEKKLAPQLKYLMCFPDVYEIGFSNLGIKVIYDILNSRSDSECESCFTPWPDMAAKLRENDTKLFSLERQNPMDSFDIAGFSLQYELSYTNMLYMMELGGVELKRENRGDDAPVIMAGGPCTINPMPLVDFVDLFCIGDGEKVIEEIAGLFIDNKNNKGSKSDFLKKAAEIDGIYAPGYSSGAVRRAIIPSLEKAPFPVKLVVPNAETVHNRAVLEIFRGCTRGCRFCQAGMIYRPVRERSVDTLVKYAEQLIVNNGYDELSLSSLSTSDYPELKQLLAKLKPILEKYKVRISLPSTRLDSFESEFADETRKSSITFAPEAGSQRLRDVINKNITEEEIFDSLKLAFSKGYSSVKLYFMIGLPTETDEDISGIIALSKKIKSFYKEHASNRKALNLSVSTSTFIPKPFTPFQWEAQIPLGRITEIQYRLRAELKKLGVRYSWHDSKSSRMEVILARGDESIGDVILSAYKSGCIFDSWTEKFDYEKWMEAFREYNLDPERFIGLQPKDRALPWEFIDAGVNRRYLLSELDKAYSGEISGDCRQGCKGCGINESFEAVFSSNCGGGTNDTL